MWILYGWEDSLAEDRFAIFNVNTGDITIYNLRGGLSSNPPVWSPDGKYLLIDVAVNENYPTILLDPHLNLGYWIAEHARPVGWLK